MSENACGICKIPTGQVESEIVHGEKGVVAFFSLGGDSMAHVLAVTEDHFASLGEITVIPEGRIGFMNTFESGYAIRTNYGSDVGQEICAYLHAHVMGGRNRERL